MQGVESQRREALQRANEVRTARAELKKRLARKEVTIRAVLVAPPAEASGMPIVELLRAVPKVGRVKADKIVRRTGTRSLTLGRIGDATRSEIMRLLP